MTTQRVYLMEWDRDPHGSGCDCGRCDMNGISHGVAICDADEPREPLDVEWGPSDNAARHNARLTAQENGWTIVEIAEDDDDHLD